MRRFSQHLASRLPIDRDAYGISARQWCEALALSVAMCGLLLWLSTLGEPIGVYSIWLALVPGFVGLKHGLMPGAVATLAWGLGTLFADGGPGIVPIHAMLPVGAAALAAGQARDHFRRTRRTLRRQAEEQKNQLEQLYRVHAVLRASHAQLQERLAAESWSLDSAVREAEQQIGERDLSGAAASLLDLLATQARVGAASLYLSATGELPAYPNAQVGAPPVVDGRNPLVRAAWERGTLVAVDRTASAERGEPQQVLIALPLITSDGRTIGVVAIHELPFVAFHDAHFSLLSMLVTRLADVMAEKLGATSGVVALAAPEASRISTAPKSGVAPRRTKLHRSSSHAHSDCLGG